MHTKVIQNRRYQAALRVRICPYHGSVMLLRVPLVSGPPPGPSVPGINGPPRPSVIKKTGPPDQLCLLYMVPLDTNGPPPIMHIVGLLSAATAIRQV